MEENTMSAKDRLAKIEEERKSLREEVAKEKKEKLENASKVRGARDSKIKEVSAVLTKVQSKIFAYNKSGKVAKSQNNILLELAELISPAQENCKDESETSPSY